ncbi:MAG: MFS transporter [Chloroflexi bacterium]|nr:MFS transporter [Chloroflexota bacterium]MBI5292198.1 MFS transporter [Chloroflexota bacterium]MBI5828205.1 MFS transporter [Chloroflexota bacterium]
MGYISLLRNRAFVALWIGESVSAMGDRINTLGLVLLVYELTGSGLAVGALTLAQAVPTLALGLLAGAVVDRYPRTAILIFSNILRGLLILTLPLARGMTHIYLVAFALSSVGVFFTPALRSALPTVVGGPHLLAANGLLKLTRETMLMIGAGLGGLLVAQFGGSAAFVINALTFFFAAACAAVVRLSPPSSPLSETGRRRVLWGEILEGLGFLRRQRALIGVQALALLFAAASGMTGPLVVVLAKDRLDLGAQGFGFILAGMSAGALAGAALAGWLGGRFSPGRLLRWSLLAFGAALLGAASTTNPVLALGAFTLYGLSSVVGGITYQTAVQAMTPDVLRGRVLSSLGLTYALTSLAALVLGGWLNDLTGVLPVFALAGVLALMGGSVAWGLLREC